MIMPVFGQRAPLRSPWTSHNEPHMSISMDEVRHVAQLARLELDDVELAAFQGELNALLGYFHDLQAHSLEGLANQPHLIDLFNVWAEDAPKSGFSPTASLRNAAVTKAGLFIAPTIIED